MAKLTKAKRSAAARKGWRTRRRVIFRQSNPTKPVKYLGVTIHGGPGDYWAYCLGQDIYTKTLGSMKNKIHRMQYAGIPRVSSRRW